MRKLLKQIVVAVLMWEARLALRHHRPFIIAVTGSVGKTTTKDAIFHVLRDTNSAVRKSRKSFNSEIGIPLTILGLPSAWHNPFLWMLYLKIGFWRAIAQRKYPKILVLEVGADHPGDVSRITSWLKPDIAVVTRLPKLPVHVEFFNSPEDVRREKWELACALKPDGILVVNGDDPYVREFCKGTNARTVTFGYGEDVEVKGSHPGVHYGETGGNSVPIGTTFHVDGKGKSYRVNINGVVGIQSATAALAALAVGLAMEESMERMTKALETFETPPGRMRVIHGKKGSVIIDDSYNSSPVAAEAALETLRAVDGKRKVAMLGDMLELGEFSEEEHRKVGRIAGSFVDILITVGERAQWMAEGAEDAGLEREKVHKFQDSETAGKWMAECVHFGDIILAKGSEGSGANIIRMERAVKQLMEHPEDATKLLVRQEDEWQRQYK